MQVYRELPITTNQYRSRPAHLVGICSVLEEWTVARHLEEAKVLLKDHDNRLPFVIDAGSGMYLNAMLLDIDLYPRVSSLYRERALSMAAGGGNVRREARCIELSLAGAQEERRSIWKGEPRYDTTMIYLRPEMEDLEERISFRSRRIVNEGLTEVGSLLDSLVPGVLPNVSVRDSIGFRELAGVAQGEISKQDAESRINTRTRKLARRQIRWFDKLSSTLQGRANIITLRNLHDDEATEIIDGLCSTKRK
ncbi:MAG: tRNA dimethylallyltransferase [Rubrobacteraceae bacterium]